MGRVGHCQSLYQTSAGERLSMFSDYTAVQVAMHIISHYTVHTRWVMHKSLIGGWRWCPIRSLSWLCPYKIPLGCSQKAGKQTQVFPPFLLWLYKPPANLSLKIRHTGLAFPVLSSVRRSSAFDFRGFWWPCWVWTHTCSHNILQFRFYRLVYGVHVLLPPFRNLWTSAFKISTYVSTARHGCTIDSSVIHSSASWWPRFFFRYGAPYL